MRETLKNSRGIKIGSYETKLLGKTIVYDKNNIRLGEIRPSGNRLIAYDKMNRKIAEWNERDDYTYDSHHRKIAKGNVLIDLYFEE